MDDGSEAANLADLCELDAGSDEDSGAEGRLRCGPAWPDCPSPRAREG